MKYSGKFRALKSWGQNYVEDHLSVLAQTFSSDLLKTLETSPKKVRLKPMKNEWNTIIIDPTQLIKIAREDQKVLLKYLRQFQELIPPRTTSLQESLQAEDRIKVRQHVHKMSPQLQFFGLQGIKEPINRLEAEHKEMPLQEMTHLVNELIQKIDQAMEEVNAIINHHF
ncbi:MAG: HPt (histidine-containing phosphotransfer) domain-containing protein [Flavobacteriales bacterium]